MRRATSWPNKYANEAHDGEVLISSLLAATVALGSRGRETPTIGDVVRTLSHSYGSFFWRQPPSLKLGVRWIHTKLTRKATLSAVVRSVEQQFKAAKRGEEFVSKLRDKALAAQKSAPALLAWATASLLEAREDGQHGINYWDASNHARERGVLMWLVALAPDPADWSYSRARFILEGGAGATVILPFADDLLREDSSDDWVLRTQARLLSRTRVLANSDRALAIATGLLEKEPSRLSNIGLMGGLYLDRWLDFGRRRADGANAIKWDEDYIAKAPAGSPVAAEKKHVIALIRAELRSD